MGTDGRERREDALLLVEDDPLVAHVVLWALRGFRVRHAATLAEVCSLLREDHWSAAIVDLRLKDGSGIDVARMLRDSCPETPIVFYSSEQDPVILGRAREFGPVIDKCDGVQRVLAVLGLSPLS